MSTRMNSALDPNVIFATIANGGGEVTSMDINNDITIAAAGFSSGAVRVWGLDQSSNSPVISALKAQSCDISEILPRDMSQSHHSSMYKYKSSNIGLEAFSSKKGSDDWNRSYLPTIELIGHEDSVFSVSLSSSSRFTGYRDRLLSVSADESIRLWEIKEGCCLASYMCLSMCWDIDFDPQTFYFVASGTCRSAYIYCTDRIYPFRILSGHEADVTCCKWAENGVLLLTGSDDGTCRLWDFRSSKAVRVLKSLPAVTGLSTDSNSIAPLQHRGNDFVEFLPTARPTARIQSIAVSPDSTHAAAGYSNGYICAWDLRTEKTLAAAKEHGVTYMGERAKENRHSSVHSMSFSEDGRVLSSGGADCLLKVWHMELLHEGARVEPLSTPSTSIAGYADADAPVDSGNNGGIGDEDVGTSSGLQSHKRARRGEGGIDTHRQQPRDAIRSHHTFGTKYTPIFCVGYSYSNTAYAGGPFSMSYATDAIMNTAETSEESASSLGLGSLQPLSTT